MNNNNNLRAIPVVNSAKGTINLNGHTVIYNVLFGSTLITAVIDNHTNSTANTINFAPDTDYDYVMYRTIQCAFNSLCRETACNEVIGK